MRNYQRFLISFYGCIVFFINQSLPAQDYAVASLLAGRNWDTCRLTQANWFSEAALKSITAQVSLQSETSITASGIAKQLIEYAKPRANNQRATEHLFSVEKKGEQLKSQAIDTNLKHDDAKRFDNRAKKPEGALSSIPIEVSTSQPKDNLTDASLKKEEKISELGEEYTGMIPKYYALVIGVSKYRSDESALPSLEYPVKDAKRIKKILIEKYAFDEQAVKLLENPTRSMVIDSFEEIAASITAKDNLLIFYAGHGFYDKEKGFGYWLPADARTTSKSDWISNTIIRDYMTAISAKHTLLISDACFSGSIFKSRNVMANMITKISEMYKYPSRRAMTSGNLSQVPDKSFFAEFLIKRLTDNEDAFLPAQTLFYRIYEPVNNNSPATPQFGVVQGTGDEGGDFIFIKRTKR